MPSLKDRIENNIAIWLLGSVLSGFLAGIGTYEGALNLMSLETITSDRLKILESSEPAACENASEVFSVPLPEYLGSAEIELLFNKVKAAYNSEDTDALYELIGPIGRAQVSKDSARLQLELLHDNLGGIENAFFVQHQFVGRLGLYKNFALNFSVKYEKAEKGIATITVIDDGSSFQVYGIMFNRL